MVVARSPRPPPWPRNFTTLAKKKCLYLATFDLDLFFNTIQACRPKETFFCTPFVARILTPDQQNQAVALFWSVDVTKSWIQKSFFVAMFEKEFGRKP